MNLCEGLGFDLVVNFLLGTSDPNSFVIKIKKKIFAKFFIERAR